MKRFFTLALSLLALFTSAPAAAAPTVPITHVVVIAMENHSRSQVIGASSAPYINSLAKTYGEATHYVNLNDPSLPNYMEVTGGTNAGITTDCLPGASCGSNGPSIFSQVTWKAWNQNMPKPCDKQNASGDYVAHHNPAVYYRTLTTCATNDIALPAQPTVSTALTFITPDECDDMHSCSIQTADNWLKGYLPKILATSQYKAGNTAVFIWWDEWHKAASGTLPFVVVSPDTHGVSYTGTINHYSTLRTIEDLLGASCLANACKASSFATAFNLK